MTTARSRARWTTRLAIVGILAPIAIPAIAPVARAAGGNVAVTVSDGRLKIVGDEADNAIGVTAGMNPDEFDIYGTDGTTVNGGPSYLATGITGRTLIKLDDGNDTLVIGETPNFPGDLKIVLGDGDDSLDLTDTHVVGNLVITGGDGADTIVSNVAMAGKSLKVKSGSGADVVAFSDFLGAGRTIQINSGADGDTVTVAFEVASPMTIKTSSGSDHVTTSSATFASTLSVALGADDDTFAYQSTSFGEPVRLDGGSGTDTLDDQGGNTVLDTFATQSFEIILP